MNYARSFVFVTGFPRGGTSWLRNCIGSHPDVAKVPGELPVMHLGSAEKIEAACADAARNLDEAPRYVSKAPADAVHVHKAAQALPESRFLFIVRDPRDVVVSHQRGSKAWMGKGRNGSVSGVLDKLEKYYTGYEKCRDSANVMLVKYEDLHQAFGPTYRSILDFLDLPSGGDVIQATMKCNSFIRQTGRKHIEDRGAARRKGVIGDWAVHLDDRGAKTVESHRFGSSFMREYGYEWRRFSFETIVDAMMEAGVRPLSEEDLLESRIDPDGCSVALMHDIDMLDHRTARQSILETARIEGEANCPALYNFLPVDDSRYRRFREQDLIDLISEIRAANPQAYLGLHLNASEKLFPASADECDDPNDPRIRKTVEYLHAQVDRWESLGVRFRLGTAHGYGRGKKVPNNRDTPLYSEELESRGILLYDTMIRPRITEKSSVAASFTDVGESIRVRQMPASGSIIDPDTYRQLPPNAFIRFLTHPGNYDVRKPTVMGFREDLPAAWNTSAG